MICSPGKVANCLNPQCVHLCKMWLMWNFTLLYWNCNGGNLIKIHVQALNSVGSTEKQNGDQPVRGKRTFLPTHLFGWVACACVCRCVLFCLWLGSSPGVGGGNVVLGRKGSQRIIAFWLTSHQGEEVLKSEPCLSSLLLFNLHRSLASGKCSSTQQNRFYEG